jgi:formylglycine-generating enzyme required for sulfatase activity
LLAAYGWFLDNSEVAGKRSAHCVGQKKPNPWGIHDMYGNVWEWCLDVHAKEIPGGRDPFSTKGTPGDHTIRGGGWSYEVEAFRWQDRLGLKEGSFQHDLGFRVALTPVQPAK